MKTCDEKFSCKDGYHFCKECGLEADFQDDEVIFNKYCSRWYKTHKKEYINKSIKFRSFRFNSDKIFRYKNRNEYI